MRVLLARVSAWFDVVASLVSRWPKSVLLAWILSIALVAWLA